jgi:CPA1 family monovalent cation:H+ antiporter
MFETAAIIVSIAAILNWVNYKYVRLPSAIGVMLMALAASLVLVFFGEAERGFRGEVAELIAGIDFYGVMFHWMLPFLLFAGALHVDLGDLRREWLAVTLLAVVGTAACIFTVGGGLFLTAAALGMPIPWLGCLLFGALISPTDPIAVLGIMKSAKAPASIEIQVSGESLFNDGIGVVGFMTLVALAQGEALPSPVGLLMLVVREIGGGVLVGGVTGGIALLLIRRVDSYQVEVPMTVATAMGSYALAEAVHASAPIAAVVAGIFVGHCARSMAMSAQTTRRVDEFWELIDDFLNASLFILIGLEVIVLPLHWVSLWVGAAAIVVSLAARLVIVAGIALGMKGVGRGLVRGSVPVLTWGGLRGGVSLALALALPAADHRDTLLAAAYVVVVFSVLVQGLTIAGLIQRSFGREDMLRSSGHAGG